ncbi:MAG: ECF-type sigma factor [Planctomycetota bacterium]
MSEDGMQFGGVATSEVSRLLTTLHDTTADAAAPNRLLELVYGELRDVAGALVHNHERRRGNITLMQPTALVHEAWMKLSPHLESVENRGHFFAIASKAMRQVLSDYAKAQRREKRGGNDFTLVLDDNHSVEDPNQPPSTAISLIDLDSALTDLTGLNERHARVAEMRLLGAMTIPEIAMYFDVTTRTIENDWSMARAWLSRALTDRSP